jgi:hypothetical protein
LVKKETPGEFRKKNPDLGKREGAKKERGIKA